MIKEAKQFILMMNTSIGFSVLSSVAITLCFWGVRSAELNDIFRFIIPIIFWTCLIAEQICIWRANALRKRLESIPEYKVQTGKPGIISFMQTKAGKVADVLFAVSVVLYIAFEIAKFGTRSYQFIVLAIIVLSFRMHCTLNGKNFKYKEYLGLRSKGNDK